MQSRQTTTLDVGSAPSTPQLLSESPIIRRWTKKLTVMSVELIKYKTEKFLCSYFQQKQTCWYKWALDRQKDLRVTENSA